MGARAGLAAVFLAVAVVLVGWYFLQPGTMSQQDEDHVYCLAPAHLDGLVSAVVSLGLAGQGRAPETVVAGGRTLPVTQWRSEHDADFERACSAYAAANVPAQSASSTSANEIQQVLVSLLSVIGGAMLAIFAADIKDAADRRGRQAAELRTNWDAFRATANYFVTRAMQPAGSLPATGELEVKRLALVASLQHASRGRRKPLVVGKPQVPPEAHKVLGDLTGMLGADIGYGWGAAGTEDSERARRLKDLLRTDGDLIEKVVAGLERKK